MKINRPTRGSFQIRFQIHFLGAILLVVTALWSLLRFEQTPGPDGINETRIGPVAAVAEPAAALPAPLRTSVPRTSKISIVDDVLRTGRDDDPRLDRELRHLDAATRQQIRNRYAQAAPEKRNQRGTLVFLLGRNLKSNADFTFLGDVLNEPPCLNLADCTKSVGVTRSHQQAGIAVTLAYPQLVALDALNTYLRHAEDVSVAIPVLEIGSRSPNPLVARAADRLRQKYLPSVARMDRQTDHERNANR